MYKKTAQENHIQNKDSALGHFHSARATATALFINQEISRLPSPEKNEIEKGSLKLNKKTLT